MGIIEIIIRYRDGFASGLMVTLELCLSIWFLGIFGGITFGYLGSRYNKFFGNLIRTGSFLLSGIPLLVFLFWLHYPLQEILAVNINPFFTAVVALGIINIFSVANLIKNALDEFPNQYVLVAKMSGLSSLEIFKKIEFPIVFRDVVPTLLKIQVDMLQMTLFASLISVEEIFRVAQRINATIYKPVEIYSSLAIFFLAICLPLNWVAIELKRKYTRNISEK
jgi:polar amino acid transport system permease protein